MNTQEIVETKTGKDSGSSALTILASLPESHYKMKTTEHDWTPIGETDEKEKRWQDCEQMHKTYEQLHSEYDAKLAELDRLIAENNAKLAANHLAMQAAIADAQTAISTAIDKLKQ